MAFPLIILAVAIVSIFGGGIDELFGDHDPVHSEMRARCTLERFSHSRDTLCRCGSGDGFLTLTDYSASYGAECYGAVFDYDHGLRWPGNPDGSLPLYLGMGVQEPTPAWGLMLRVVLRNTRRVPHGCRSSQAWRLRWPCLGLTCSAMRSATHWTRGFVHSNRKNYKGDRRFVLRCGGLSFGIRQLELLKANA